MVILLAGFVCGCQSSRATQTESEGGWRPLPLVNNGKVDPSWVQVGWGGFVADDGALRSAPDPKHEEARRAVLEMEKVDIHIASAGCGWAIAARRGFWT